MPPIHTHCRTRERASTHPSRTPSIMTALTPPHSCQKIVPKRGHLTMAERLSAGVPLPGQGPCRVGRAEKVWMDRRQDDRRAPTLNRVRRLSRPTGIGREREDPLPKKTNRKDRHHSRPAERDPPTDKNKEPSPTTTRKWTIPDGQKPSGITGLLTGMKLLTANRRECADRTSSSGKTTFPDGWPTGKCS